jgi:hypothetical protein
MYNFVEGVLFFLLVVLESARAIFRPRPQPSDAQLISGTAPAGHGNTRPLSRAQLEQLQSWLELHQEGWKRDPFTPPSGSSYMVQVAHSDGIEMLVCFFLRQNGRVYFQKALQGGRLDSAWRSLPVEEVGSLIAMLKNDE